MKIVKRCFNIAGLMAVAGAAVRQVVYNDPMSLGWKLQIWGVILMGIANLIPLRAGGVSPTCPVCFAPDLLTFTEGESGHEHHELMCRACETIFEPVLTIVDHGVAAPVAEGVPRDWQPIATAPNNCAVLAGEIRDGEIKWAQTAILRDGIWRLHDFMFALDNIWVERLTHWMPLPDPPAAAVRAGGVSPGSELVLGWQPIETAPRNGPILVVVGNPLHADAQIWRRVDIAKRDISGTLWLSPEGYDLQPTHWMPLPAVPTPQE